MDVQAPLSAEALLEHEHFVRSIARGLLSDRHAAEDVTQETWLRALQRGPAAVGSLRGSLRGWLARVGGNLARDARRSSTRRSLREERAARAEAEESVGTAFERLSLQRDVASAILELDEPYRSVVLLRYHHDLEPTEIGARLRAKPATVRTQLVRAHELLRAKLDSRYRREVWAGLLLPLADLRSKDGVAGSAVAVGLAVAAAVSIAVVWTVLQESERGAAPASVAAAQPSAERTGSAPSLQPAQRTPSETQEPGAAVHVPAVGASAGAAPAASVRETLSARATLLAREKYDDYEKATFSFELGLRDDPTGIVGNDWDLQFADDRFDTKMVVSDASHIVDLGDVRLKDLASWRGEPGARAEEAPAYLGHTYFVWTRDDDTDLASAFEVLELVPGERCVLEWYSTADGVTARGSLRDERPERPIAARLLELRGSLRRSGELRTPRVLLQGRNDSGSRNRVDIAGEFTRFDERSSTPLDLFAPIGKRESVGYCEGGWVPEGKVFLVTRATYRGSVNSGEGSGSFALVIAGERVFESEGAGPVQGAWSGSLEIPPGLEMLTFLELRDTSSGEAELFGEFVDRPGLIAKAPPKRPRKPRPVQVPTELREARVHLQARNGAGGGNPFRVKQDGSLSYFRTLAKEPLDLLAPIDGNEEGLAYCDGGLVPEGKVFVVTRVDYWGLARGDSNGDGGFAVAIAGERIVERNDVRLAEGEEPETIQGTWVGRIEVRRDDETRTYLEVCNSSVGEATLWGEFVAER